MLEFFKSHRKHDAGGEGAVDAWERQFMRGLELLLCECVVVRDEVERECFISRVYAWFMEKLVERKGLDNVGAPRGEVGRSIVHACISLTSPLYVNVQDPSLLSLTPGPPCEEKTSARME